MIPALHTPSTTPASGDLETHLDAMRKRWPHIQRDILEEIVGDVRLMDRAFSQPPVPPAADTPVAWRVLDPWDRYKLFSVESEARDYVQAYGVSDAEPLYSDGPPRDELGRVVPPAADAEGWQRSIAQIRHVAKYAVEHEEVGLPQYLIDALYGAANIFERAAPPLAVSFPIQQDAGK